jgi:hypothetical protein
LEIVGKLSERFGSLVSNQWVMADDAEAAIAERYRLMSPLLNERQRRRFAASEARTLGRGGIAAAARPCGLAENTVRKGLTELEDPEPLAAERVRAVGPDGISPRSRARRGRARRSRVTWIEWTNCDHPADGRFVWRAHASPADRRAGRRRESRSAVDVAG